MGQKIMTEVQRPRGMEVFGRLRALRRRRNRTEYRDPDSPGVHKAAARQALDTPPAAVDAVQRILDIGALHQFE